MSLATLLEMVFCPQRAAERDRLGRLLDETARDLGVSRLGGTGVRLPAVVRAVARDMGMSVAADRGTLARVPEGV